ncbi:MAG: ferredoxin reductase family protein [Cohaesibacter sp.]|jgi:predicted ferric reductase|nr:ferredoxin reductase family protein [Cohaesibacter sp.]
MKPSGLLLIFASLLPPLALIWQFSAQHDVSILFSQYAGAVSLISMAWIQLMATRLPGIEATFGPLDQVYVLHKWLAVFAISAAFLHESIDANPFGESEKIENGSSAMQSLGILSSLQGFAEDLGEIGYNGILILGLGSLISFIPYHIWRWSHRLIGLFFAAAAFHYLLIRKPFEVMADPVGLYIAIFCIVGIGSFLYLSAKGMLARKASYQITEIDRQGTITNITLSPCEKARKLSYRAGQFAFLSFEQDGFSEAHPFTISSAPCEDGSLRFSIASLGDYTSRLHGLKAGTKARLSGGYGRFLKPRSDKEQIWIAGGVGITPFLAWLQTVPVDAKGKITLYYGLRSLDASPFRQELEAHAARLANLEIHFFESDKGQRLTADFIAQDWDAPLTNIPVAFCGPAPMREALKTGLAKHGHTPKKFHYEEFQLRSGLGLRRLWRYISGRFGKRLLALTSAHSAGPSN